MWTWDQNIQANAYGCFIPAAVIDNVEAHDRVWEFFNGRDRWPNFSMKELRSKGNGDLRIHYDTLDAMQSLRNRLKRELVVTSYYRDPAYNREVGGAEDSYHLAGRAVDTPVLNTDVGRMLLVHYATWAGFKGFGRYPTFTHLDTGPVRVW